MTGDLPLLTGIGRVGPQYTSYFSSANGDPNPYVDLDILQSKPHLNISREALLNQLQTLFAKVISLLEVSIIMHVLLVFLAIIPSFVLLAHYLGESKDFTSAVLTDNVENGFQFYLEVLTTVSTLAILIIAYFLSCWESRQGIRRFSWIFSLISMIALINLGLQFWNFSEVFSKAVLLSVRALVLVFNAITIKIGFKLEKVHGMLEQKNKYLADVELQSVQRSYRHPPGHHVIDIRE